MVPSVAEKRLVSPPKTSGLGTSGIDSQVKACTLLSAFTVYASTRLLYRDKEEFLGKTASRNALLPFLPHLFDIHPTTSFLYALSYPSPEIETHARR